MNALTALALLSLFTTFASCTMGSNVMNGKATVVPPAIAVGEVAPLRGGAPIAVTAGAAKDEWFVMSPKDPEQTAANLKVWTTEATAGFARDLATIGGKTDIGAAKQVEITVTSVTAESGFAKARVTVTLQVKTGDGHSASFTRDTSSMRGTLFCSEDAMRNAIMDALKDSRVRGYLES